MSNESNRQTITVIVVCVVLVVLLGGGYWLYNKLGGGLAQDNLMVQSSEQTLGSEQAAQPSKGDFSDGQADAPGSDKVLAEDFTVYDKEGSAVKLSDFKGKPVILNFWASWCSPCKSEMPDFEKVYKEYGGKIHFLIVNLTDGYQETKQKATAFIEQSGYTFPVYFDSDSDAAITYGIYSIPETYFIDSEGYIVAQGKGALDYNSLMQGVEMLVG